MIDATRSLWGLTPAQLHDRFWASKGVQVVRHGEPFEVAPIAELFLLTDARSLVHFRLAPLLDLLYWNKPQLVCARLHDGRDTGYRERAIADERHRFVRFERTYGADAHPVRVGLTRDRELARAWQASPDPRRGWQRLRRLVPSRRRSAAPAEGRVYARASGQEIGEFARHLVLSWKRPDITIPRASRARGEVWADSDARINSDASFVGPVWVGAGRHLDQDAEVIGPSILWDRPDARPPVQTVQWEQIEPIESSQGTRPAARSSLGLAGKRVFDIAFSLLLLGATLPLYGLVMLAIWIEDGRPFFFLHRRETLGGAEFPCIKFRSMRKNAESLKAALVTQNRADGPQFFMERDPRLTHVGRFLRRYNLDELPQFINVLLGHMSIVGPRPSPRKENQFCPAWREARLSVRPGITGLWQVKRTRDPGRDFQEWIKYDIEYVERASWRLDLLILLKTFGVLIKQGGG